MSKFSYDGNEPLSAALFAEYCSKDDTLRRLVYPFKYQTRNGGTGYVTTTTPYNNECYEISPEQMAEAKELYEQRRAEKLQEASQPGTLFMCCMGSNYAPMCPGDMTNHRVRCYFYDRKGHKWFIEVMTFASPGRWGGTITDVSYEEAENERHQREYKALHEQYGDRIPHNKRPKMPGQRHENIQTDEPYTEAGVLAFINKRFKTKFKRLYVDHTFFLRDDDLQSRSE